MATPSYRIVIEMNDVAEGDATTLAQSIWDENAVDFDAPLGDFKMSVSKIEGDSSFDTGWDPA